MSEVTRFFPGSRFTSVVSLVAAFSIPATYAVTYDIRAQTGDKVRATAAISQAANGVITYAPANVRQGSFGSPSINDKGTIAYACILSGKGLGAFTNNSVVQRLAGKGKKVRARVAVQSGFVLATSFLPGYDPLVTFEPGMQVEYNVEGSTFSQDGTQRMYKITRDVAVNNKNVVAFGGRLLYTAFTYNNNGISVTRRESSMLGQLKPTSSKATAFAQSGLVTYLNYNPTILEKRIAISPQGATAFNGDVFITSTESVPGFGYAYPGQATTTVANTNSDVIGLPYFTEFSDFSEAVITDDNTCWVVANLSDTGSEFDGIWQGNNPDLQPVVVLKDKSPGGGTFSTFVEPLGPSRDGKLVAFIANESSGSGGVYRANVDGTGIKSIVQRGVKAPSNTASGTLGTFSSLDLAACNTAGQVAVLGSVAGTNGSATRTGVWVSDKSGNNLTLVVVEGQKISIGSTEKTVTKLAFNPLSAINRKGQIAFTASFGDRTSAVIVAKP